MPRVSAYRFFPSPPEAHGFEFRVDACAGVLRRPATRILKEPDGANLTAGAEIEPVQCSARHANEISGFYFDRGHRPGCWPDVKQAAAMNDEAHFVFVVPMFAIELGEHGVE